MSIEAIRAMFHPGQQWHVHRTGGGAHASEVRTVCKITRRNLGWLVHGGKFLRTAWPTAYEVIEARPGFLKFRYEDVPSAVVTLIAQ